MKPALTYYALLVLLLASCFSCKTDSEKKKFVIGVSQCTLEGSWRKSMLLDMKVQASEYPGVSLLVEDAADSSLLQVEQIRSLIKRKVDLLIISANESEPVTPIAIEAYRAGIPTILVDRQISSAEYTTYIGLVRFFSGAGSPSRFYGGFELPHQGEGNIREMEAGNGGEGDSGNGFAGGGGCCVCP